MQENLNSYEKSTLFNCRYECLTRQHNYMFILYRVSQKNGHLSLPIAILHLDLSRINPGNSNPNLKKSKFRNRLFKNGQLKFSKSEKMGHQRKKDTKNSFRDNLLKFDL